MDGNRLYWAVFAVFGVVVSADAVVRILAGTGSIVTWVAAFAGALAIGAALYGVAYHERLRDDAVHPVVRYGALAGALAYVVLTVLEYL